MAYIIRSNEDMVGMLKRAIADAQQTKPQMLIVPVVMPEDPAQVAALLLDIPQYSPRRSDQDLPANAVGTLTLGGERTVDDVLDEQENHSMVDVRDALAMFECSTDVHVPGKTRVVDAMFGQLIVDLAKYARLLGLPTAATSNNTYTVFVLQSPRPSGQGVQTVFVAVSGAQDISGGDGREDGALEPLLARLEARRGAGFDFASKPFFTRQFANGWQVFNNKQFLPMLGGYRSGYYFRVSYDSDRGGMNFQF